MTAKNMIIWPLVARLLKSSKPKWIRLLLKSRMRARRDSNPRRRATAEEQQNRNGIRLLLKSRMRQLLKSRMRTRGTATKQDEQLEAQLNIVAY
jgi:hypothetical protein